MKPRLARVLVHAVVVGVVTHVVPAEEHLARRAAVDVDERRPLGRSARRLEQLSVDLEAVARLEDHLLRRHQLRRRELRRHAVLGEAPRRAAGDGPHGRQRRVLRVRLDVDERPAVGRDRGRPVDRRARRDRGGHRRVHWHPVEMPAVDVQRIRARVRTVDDEAAVGAHGRVLDHEIAGRQQRRRATGGRHRIEVRPPVLVAHEHDAVGRRARPGRRHVAGDARGAVAHPRAARPGGACLTRLHVADPQRPRLRLRLERRHAALPRAADEEDLRPVGRPRRRAVARGGRRNVAQRLIQAREQRDEAVIAAVGDEGERRAVGRPGGRLGRAAREHLLGGLRPVERPDPDLPVLHERDAMRLRRGRRIVAVGDERRRAAALGGNGPDLHLRLHGAAGRIGLKVAFRRPVGSVVAAADVDDRLSVIGERDARQFLPVVLVVGRDLARGEVRRVGDVDVAGAVFVEGPRDAGARRRRDEVFGERIAHHLIEGEGGSGLPRGHGGDRESDDRDERRGAPAKLLHAGSLAQVRRRHGHAGCSLMPLREAP